MQIDALTLAALADELRSTLLGARIEDVIQPTPHAIALQCYGGGRNRWLLASAHPQLARLHFTEAKPRKLTAEPPPFVMLLRKHLEGARVVAISHPRSERLIALGFARGPSSENQSPALWLVVEVMGRFSNVILHASEQDGAEILGALHTVSGEVNRYRTIMPHAPYRQPPPQTRTLRGETLPRLDGARVTAAELREAALDLLAARDAAAASMLTTGEEAQPPLAKPGKRQRGKQGRREAPPTVAGLLTAHLAGWSRELGREVAARALGDPDAPLIPDLPWDALAAETRALGALPETHAWRPTLVYGEPHPLPPSLGGKGPLGEGLRQVDAGEPHPPNPSPAERGEIAGSPPLMGEGQGVGSRAEWGPPMAFAVYEPRQYGDARLRAMPGVDAMLAAYFEGAEWRAAVEGAKGELRRLLQTNHDRATRKDEVLRGELAALAEAQRLREEADVLLAFQAEVPPHVASVTLPNPFSHEDGATLMLALDPRFTAIENANRRYARYHKLQRAASLIPPQIEANQLELARIAQLQTDLDLAETSPEIALVRREVAEAGYLREKADPRLARKPSMQGKLGGKAGKGAKSGKGGKPGGPGGRASEGGTPLRRVSSDGFPLLVGKNSRQNEEVTFRQASANDLWLHARGVPGAHVIVKSGGRSVPDTTLREAAALAAYYSQSRAAGTVPVDVTEPRYVRHMKGGGPGMVTYERERTFNVAPADVAVS